MLNDITIYLNVPLFSLTDKTIIQLYQHEYLILLLVPTELLIELRHEWNEQRRGRETLTKTREEQQWSASSFPHTFWLHYHQSPKK